MGCCNSKDTKKKNPSQEKAEKPAAKTKPKPTSDDEDAAAFDDLGLLQPTYEDEFPDDFDDAIDQEIPTQSDPTKAAPNAARQSVSGAAAKYVRETQSGEETKTHDWYEREQEQHERERLEELEKSRQYIREFLSSGLQQASDVSNPQLRKRAQKHKITFEEITDEPAKSQESKLPSVKPVPPASVPKDDEDDIPALEDNHSRPAVQKKTSIDAPPETRYIQGHHKRTICIEPGLAEMCNFVVEDCTECDIYICNALTAVNIDSCIKCRIFVGPCKDIIRISNSEECNFVIAASEIQMLQCKDSNILVFARKGVKIHLCLNLKFGCFVFSYSRLAEQFTRAGLSVFNNRWSEIKDLSSLQFSWSYLSLDSTPEALLPNRPPERMISFKRTSLNVVVPLMHGDRPKTTDEVVFALFLPNHGPAALQCVESLIEKGFFLLKSREAKLKTADLENLMTCFENYTEHRKSRQNLHLGPTIGLLFNGPDVCEAVFDMSQVYNQIDSYPFIFTTRNPETTKRATEIYFESKRERKAGKA